MATNLRNTIAGYIIIVPIDKLAVANARAILWDPDDGRETFTYCPRFTSGDPEVVTHHGVETRATEDMATQIELLPPDFQDIKIYKDSTWSFALADLGLTRYVEEI